MDFAALTQKGFHFFEYFFRYVNWFLKKFDQGDNGVCRQLLPRNADLLMALFLISYQQVFRVLNLDLVGLDNAWRAAIEPNDESVAMQAIEFINKLHKTVMIDFERTASCADHAH